MNLDTSRYYKIIAKHSGKCLDVLGKSHTDFTPIVQHDFRNGENQQWKLIPAGDGYYSIAARHSNKLLNIIGGDKGEAIIQFEQRDWDSQKWQLIPDQDKYFFIANKKSGLYLTVPASHAGNCVVVIQYEKTDGDNQRWEILEPSVNLSPSIESSRSGKRVKCDECEREIEVTDKEANRVHELKGDFSFDPLPYNSEHFENIDIGWFNFPKVLCEACGNFYFK